MMEAVWKSVGGWSNPYRWAMLLGILLSAMFWLRLARRDRSLMILYGCALGGAFLGAKLGYLFAEGWLDWRLPDVWLRWASGKTVLGALVGGWVSVEVAKKQLGYTQVTGDWFAAVVPAAIALGRLGCIHVGCCPGHVCEGQWYAVPDASGVGRWPAAWVELGFNVFALGLFWGMRRGNVLAGQHFHLYLMGYGLFRFWHESLRETPAMLGGMSGYQILAAGLFLVATLAFRRRQRLLLKRS